MPLPHSEGARTRYPHCSSISDPTELSDGQLQARGVVVPTAQREPLPQPETVSRKSQSQQQSIVIIGGGVSGIWSALTLHELGYTNVTILEKEMRVGGKASSFAHKDKHYPLGAVGTPLALESASFTESKLFEQPLKFGASLFGRTGQRLQVLNANHLIVDDTNGWPGAFPTKELTDQTPVSDWQRAFGTNGRPERFYPHHHDFTSPRSMEMADQALLPKIVPRWGRPESSWPLVYVSAHGYGVARAADAPPYYYWARFAQKATNAGAKGPLGMALPGHTPLGPRGPALRGWDSTALFEEKLERAGVQVRTGAAVSSITREASRVHVTTTDGYMHQFDHMVLAADLKGSLRYLDADEQERSLFSEIRHLPYYTVVSYISLPWLATGSVYYFGQHQGPKSHTLHEAMDAGRATAGCPTIMLKANRGSNLTITWAYGGEGIGPPQMEACLRSTVLNMGGKFGGIHFIKPWLDYFPHVPAEQLRVNYHRKLDALQGRKRMLMVGEVFNLPLVSECVDWDGTSSGDTLGQLHPLLTQPTGHVRAQAVWPQCFNVALLKVKPSI
eukprot:CAMPEP_0115853044 /NCGR_PEP_ID=MMETSP0287-20121206/13304_1 /TAXON_ID=412157 /ORGANISM="Chrysochromulina rotalis, Strain UIO044" /LENGTH=558 /DNA_ID=CAMNT_0003307115 /DNA_START=78 /DNA_END=1755 /DNA_ORIENTATION=-